MRSGHLNLSNERPHMFRASFDSKAKMIFISSSCQAVQSVKLCLPYPFQRSDKVKVECNFITVQTSYPEKLLAHFYLVRSCCTAHSSVHLVRIHLALCVHFVLCVHLVHLLFFFNVFISSYVFSSIYLDTSSQHSPSSLVL